MSSKILAALFLVGGASALYAAPVYSCGGGAACDGNLYAIWVVSQTAASYVLDVGIQVTNSYTGSTTDSINGLAIVPDNNRSFISAGLLSAPPTGTWAFQTGGLNSSGCDGSGAAFICAAGTGTGSPLFLGGGTIPDLLIWQFTIIGTPPPTLGDTAHIKYSYVDLSGKNVGDLGSFDIAIQCLGGTGCDASTTPEPMTSTLIGSGLVGLYFIRRRFPR